jgi:DNA excision repair protein ERCC-3
VIYDEVHLLPAPVFRVTSGIQATRRLGLTATLVREDGREEDVFTLIGPKKYEMPWKALEEQGWIAEARCQEIRLPFEANGREAYARANARQKFRIAAENPRKLQVVRHLLERHADDRVLIIGQYVGQLQQLAEALNLPLITGKVPEKEREALYRQFKRGEITRLAVSKVANFAVDLPDANVAIQISGTFGSRQEEAQRLGRILRPKERDNAAYFYTLVTRDTREQEFALHRQLFLVEQGYHYDVIEMDALD